MSEQELLDPLLLAVRSARPALDDAALSPTGADALRVLQRAMHGEETPLPLGDGATVGQQGARGNRIPAMRRILRPRFAAIGIAAAAIVFAAVIVLSGLSGGPSLVDRAYAAINPGYQVLHEVDIQTDASVPGWVERYEAWLLPADGRARLINIWGYKRSPFVAEWIITATGREFYRVCLSYCHPALFTRGRSGWAPVAYTPPGTLGGTQATLPGTFARLFRAAYRAHSVVPDGTTTFAGKRVARFDSMEALAGATPVFWRAGTRPPVSVRNSGFYALIDWYIDPVTARPVGFKVWGCNSNQIRACERRQYPPTTTRIITFQPLDSTPQNLALLTGPGAPRGAR